MSVPRGDRQAFGQPGLPPRWAPGDKDGVGTAYSAGSRIWFTIWNGIVTEIYYPTIDRPQTRDLRYLFSDGQTFCHDETDLDTSIEPLGGSLGFMVRDEIERVDTATRRRSFRTRTVLACYNAPKSPRRPTCCRS